MDWITHTATGYFVGQIITRPEERPRRAGWWWAIAAITPDWLEFATSWFGDVHRGVTHSLYLWPLLALAWAAAARRWGGEQVASLKRLWLVFFMILGSHLLLDVFLAYRLYFAWPFSEARWTWDVMPLFDVYVYAGWLILLLVWWRWRMPSRTTAKIGLAILLLVLALRVGGKTRAQLVALDMQSGIPPTVMVRTLPDYLQPWIWYTELPQTAPYWTAINVVTGQVVPDGQTLDPCFPPIPYADRWREHARRHHER